MAITYTKLKREDAWGLRATEALAPGAHVAVTKKDGKTKTEVVGKLAWKSEDGTVFLYTIEQAGGGAPRSSSGQQRSRRPWAPCGYPGCNPNYCDECDGRGYVGGGR